MDALQLLFYKWFGMAFHFKLVLRYTPDSNNGQTHTTKIVNVNFGKRSSIMNESAIIENQRPVILASVPPNFSRDGALEIVEIYYLGWFRRAF